MRENGHGSSKNQQAHGRNGVKARRNPTYAALHVPPGQVQLSELTDPNWARQLHALFAAHGRVRREDFTKTVSEETLRNRMDQVFSTFRLIKVDRHLRTLSQFRPRLIPRIIELWDKQGISKRAQLNYFSALSWFWAICGIRVSSIRDYVQCPEQYTIGRAAEKDKSWTGNGVDVRQKIEQIKADDPIGGRLIEAMHTYGLRPKESLRLQPHQADGVGSLLITRGSKTGRPREIVFADFDEERMQRVLALLKDEVSPEQHLAWRNRSLKQAKSRLHYLARKFGLTKSDLGVTLYGLRHEWAIDQLERLANTTAPVRGGTVVDYRKLSDVRRLIAKALGHNRTKVTSAYYGSFAALEREHARRFQTSWEKLAPSLPSIWSLLERNDVENLYLVGERSDGTNRSPVARYELLLDGTVTHEAATVLKPAIAEIVMGATGLDCLVLFVHDLPEGNQHQIQHTAVPLFKGEKPQIGFD